MVYSSSIAVTKSGVHWFEKIPKVELHLHLEGAIPHATLWALIQKYGGDPTVPTFNHLMAKFIYRNFSDFITTWIWKNQFLREYEDFEFIASEIARDLAKQNIRYVEAFYCPGGFWRRGLTPQKLTEVIRRGLNHVSGVEVALIADLIRDHGPERGLQTLAQVNEVKGLGVIGIGIGGSEHLFPPEAFKSVYFQARKLGFHTSVHAGEVAGPESVWGAIQSLEVERIGHGTRAIEDPYLVEYLAQHRLPLELCILSNFKTGVVNTISAHPVRIFFDAGIPLSINTDDPKMFGTSLSIEYQILQTSLGFSKAEIQTLILQAIETSWLTEERKRYFITEFQAEFSALKEE